MKKLRVKHKIFAFLFIALIIIIFGLSFWIFQLYRIDNIDKSTIEESNKFELLSPDIAFLDVDTFLAKQNDYSIQYLPLKQELILEINKSPEEQYGIYFEDMLTGASIGINEKDKFFPRSLFKVPVMVAILKKVQDGDITLDTRVTLNSNDLNDGSGELYKKGVGYNISVSDLLQIMIKESDNTALMTLSNHLLTMDEYVTVLSMMGLPPTSSSPLYLSPKEYSGMFRSLYYSNYLRRPFSQLALSLLAETDYNTQLVAGLPNNITVSHKFGQDDTLKLYHDCGIVYLRNKNYFLCVMSRGSSIENANLVIANVSRTVYEYVNSHNNFN